MKIIGICVDAIPPFIEMTSIFTRKQYSYLRSAILLYTPVTITDVYDPTVINNLIAEFDEMSHVATTDELHNVYHMWVQFFTYYNGKLTFTTKERQSGHHMITQLSIIPPS